MKYQKLKHHPIEQVLKLSLTMKPSKGILREARDDDQKIIARGMVLEYIILHEVPEVEAHVLHK